MYHKLQRTDGVSHALEIVRLAVREVVHRIYVPTATCAMVRVCGDNSVHDWVAKVHVWICHINLRTQNHLSILYLAVLHGLEETQVLVYWTVAVWRCYTRLSRSTFLLRDLFGCLLVNICLALFDELDGKIVEFDIKKIADAISYAKELKDRYTVLWMYYDLLVS